MPGKFVAAVEYIASIYPGKMTPIKRNYGISPQGTGRDAVCQTLFQLQPVPRGKGKFPDAFVLEVQDSFEHIPNYLGNRRERMPRLVPCEEIVNDLLKEWTGGLFNVPQGAAPGIMRIANSTPSQAELLSMMTVQTAYFQYWFLQGEQVYAGHQAAVQLHTQITDMMRLAAEWLGEKRPWSSPEIMRDQVSCIWCKKLIDGLATYCPNCLRQVREIPPELLGKFDPQKSPQKTA